jgi:uncharacterized protein with HEPN domain
MPESNLLDNFELIDDSIKTIIDRFKPIKSSEDFIKDENGKTLLDAISLRLQVIGEILKRIEKADAAILEKHAEIEWQQIMRLRDFISHHYDLLDYEIIFDICKEKIPQLEKTVAQIISELKG